jgi:hypothetical protein
VHRDIAQAYPLSLDGRMRSALGVTVALCGVQGADDLAAALARFATSECQDVMAQGTLLEPKA